MNPLNPYHFILASQSPRRLQILQEHNLIASVQPANILEERAIHESPKDYVLRLSKEKAHTIFNQSRLVTPTIILAADTTVVLGNKILEKPNDAKDAELMLKFLSGKTHEVLTGYTLLFIDALNLKMISQEISECISTSVSFFDLSDLQITEYIATGDPFDKAGAYGIQNVRRTFVKEITGSYYNVMGLPIEVILKHLV